MKDQDDVDAALVEDDKNLCEPCGSVDVEEEALPHRTLRHPYTPTKKEREDHQTLHWPYRSWCRACVFGRGKHSHHLRSKQPKENSGLVSISLDFIFLGYGKIPAKKNAILVMYDNDSDAVWAYRTGRKRAPNWLIPAMLQDLAEAGYSKSKLCFRSDQENVVKSIKDEIIRERDADSVPMESPVKESKSNGRMERAIQTLEGQVRTIVMDIQLNNGHNIHPAEVVYQYLLNWACTILNRYRVTACGKTPFQILTERRCNRPVAGFATPVLWKRSLKESERKKGDTDWDTGVFLGITWRTSEAIVASGEKVVMCRTIQRDPEHPHATPEMLRSIPESVLEVMYSGKEDEDDAEQDEPAQSEKEDEGDIAALFGEFSDEEPNGIDDTA